MRIYTDGACRNEIGGWGWWNEDTNEEASGCEVPSTNQRMELYAVLDAIETHIRLPSFTIVSDSAYVVNCFLEGWWRKWLENGWLNRTHQPIVNRDFWEPLIEMVDMHRGVRFEWVKGHNGDVGNERADALASEQVDIMAAVRKKRTKR